MGTHIYTKHFKSDAVGTSHVYINGIRIGIVKEVGDKFVDNADRTVKYNSKTEAVDAVVSRRTGRIVS